MQVFFSRFRLRSSWAAKTGVPLAKCPFACHGAPMTTEVTIAEGKRLEPHPLRAVILGEVHARPFIAVNIPRRLLHFGFDTSGERAERDRTALTEFCDRRGLPAPKPADKHHRVLFSGTVVRWEQHSEFTTYTWEFACEGGAAPFHPAASTLAASMGLLPQPGPLLVAIDMHLTGENGEPASPERLFERSSLAAAEVRDAARIFTDFQCDPSGFVRILVLAHRALEPERAGAIVQLMLELETYRTLALLGLPEAQRLAPAVGRIERRLTEVTAEMRGTEGLSANHKLLDELTALAAELEAGAAASLFRFGASRAYNEIVQLRLESLREQRVTGFPTWSAFLSRRMAPALRTCATMEQRQADLSTKLARTANLLRTRVDVELEQQNRNLLQSMNERTRLQLRLQATVEGLSVAAISYYVVGLFGHVAGAISEAGAPVNPSYVTAMFVPGAVLVIWLMVRRIRKRHIGQAL
jgi:uncharacterized membrane-anchored protein